MNEPSVWIENLDLILKSSLSILSLGFTLLSAYLLKKKYDNTVMIEAIEALEAGVSESEEKLVAWAKRANADNQLTKEERQEAMKIAREVAFRVAKGPVLNLLKSKGETILNAWIKKILERKKDVKPTA